MPRMTKEEREAIAKRREELEALGFTVEPPKRNYPKTRKKVAEKSPTFTANTKPANDTKGDTQVVPVRLDAEDIAALDALTGDLPEGRSPRIRQAVREYIARYR